MRWLGGAYMSVYLLIKKQRVYIKSKASDYFDSLSYIASVKKPLFIMQYIVLSRLTVTQHHQETQYSVSPIISMFLSAVLCLSSFCLSNYCPSSHNHM